MHRHVDSLQAIETPVTILFRPHHVDIHQRPEWAGAAEIDIIGYLGAGGLTDQSFGIIDNRLRTATDEIDLRRPVQHYPSPVVSDLGLAVDLIAGRRIPFIDKISAHLKVQRIIEKIVADMARIEFD